MLPPGTHFRGSVVTVPPTVDGGAAVNPIADADVDDDVEVVDPAEQPVQPDPPNAQASDDTTTGPRPKRKHKRKPKSTREPEPDPAEAPPTADDADRGHRAAG
jgi:hypothetical protein